MQLIEKLKTTVRDLGCILHALLFSSFLLYDSGLLLLYLPPMGQKDLF